MQPMGRNFHPRGRPAPPVMWFLKGIVASFLVLGMFFENRRSRLPVVRRSRSSDRGGRRRNGPGTKNAGSMDASTDSTAHSGFVPRFGPFGDHRRAARGPNVCRVARPQLPITLWYTHRPLLTMKCFSSSGRWANPDVRLETQNSPKNGNKAWRTQSSEKP
jgi:hypothetical protein